MWLGHGGSFDEDDLRVAVAQGGGAAGACEPGAGVRR